MLTRSDVERRLESAFEGTPDNVIESTRSIKGEIDDDSKSHGVGMFLDKVEQITADSGIDVAKYFCKDAIWAAIFPEEVVPKLTRGHFALIMHRVERVGKSKYISKVDAVITAASLINYLLVAFPDQISATPHLKSSLECLRGFVLQRDWANVEQLSKRIYHKLLG